MISRVSGKLAEVSEGDVEIDVGGIGYTVFIPPSTCATLRTMIGQPVTLFTIYDIGGSGMGGNLTPRLVGFLDPEEREFYEMLKTVNGMGPLRALRALVQPPRKIARAIEDGDVRFLRQLPEVGPRTADKIVAELKGKLERFALGEPSLAAGEREEAAMSPFKAEALTVLMNTGMSRTEALTKIEHAVRRNPKIETTEALIAEAFRQ